MLYIAFSINLCTQEVHICTIMPNTGQPYQLNDTIIYVLTMFMTVIFISVFPFFILLVTFINVSINDLKCFKICSLNYFFKYHRQDQKTYLTFK